MNRPKITRPMRESWEEVDEMIYAFLDQAKNKSLNIEKYTFCVPATGEVLSYVELRKKLLEDYPGKDYVEMFVEIMKKLPGHLETAKTEMTIGFETYIKSAQDRIRVCMDYDGYCDFIEEQIEDKDKEIEDLKKVVAHQNKEILELEKNVESNDLFTDVEQIKKKLSVVDDIVAMKDSIEKLYLKSVEGFVKKDLEEKETPKEAVEVVESKKEEKQPEDDELDILED